MAAKAAPPAMQHKALPAHVTPSPVLSKRGHARSSSLENAHSFISKNTLGLPVVLQAAHTGTLKSRNEQKRLRSKFGSHSNLDDYNNSLTKQSSKFAQTSQLQQQQQQHGQPQQQTGRLKFQNIRQFFEISKTNNKRCNDYSSSDEKEGQLLHSLPPAMTRSETSALTTPTTIQQQQQQQLAQPQTRISQQSLQAHAFSSYNLQQAQHPSPRRPTPTTATGGCGNRNSISSDLNSDRMQVTPLSQQQQQNLRLTQSITPQHATLQQQLSNGTVGSTSTLRSSNGLHTPEQNANIVRPIAFKPIPFEPDYSIPSRHCDIVNGAMHNSITDRYGSTPSLAPIQNPHLRFGSTTDLRYANVGINIGLATTMTTTTTSATTTITNNISSENEENCNNNNNNNINIKSNNDLTNNRNNNNNNNNMMPINMMSGSGAFVVGGYSSSNYCNSLMARRRGGSRSLKVNDSMESIRHTPDLDANNSQCSAIKANCNNLMINNHNNCNNNNNNNANSNNNNNNGITSNCNSLNSNHSTNSNGSVNNINQQQYQQQQHNHQHQQQQQQQQQQHHYHNNMNSKYILSGDQCDMTPSPSDSGISDLEAALKDRDSELSYLRQTMEHNEKDKETFWENETKRLKTFYDAQQQEYLMKFKKMEQMLAMQQFQMKQQKLRQNEQINKLREQMSDLKNENEIMRSNNSSLKNSERNLKDRVAYIEEQLNGSEATIQSLKAQLENNEWRICERNGEIALLKNQLKEANVEITMKDHAIVHLKQESIHIDAQQQSQKQQQQQQQYQSTLDERKNPKQKDEQQQKQQQQQNRKETELEIKQLNKIIILKDQVILALTSELAKLRKELSDLAISHEYGEEPSGKYTRLKQQLDNLTDICNKTRKYQNGKMEDMQNDEKMAKVLDDNNLELIMNCLKIAPPIESDGSDNDEHPERLSTEKRLAKMSADIQNFVYGSQNLPDIAVNTQLTAKLHKLSTELEETTTLDTLIEESANYAGEIAKLRKQLDDVRVNFELEKRQWCEEKEKVLRYQKQLQTHYISMYQKLKSLENSNLV